MHAALTSFAIVGVDALPVTVEVDSTAANSLDTAVWSVVGLGDAAIRESRERVKAALKNSGLRVSQKRITISLAPADLRKEGSHYDLPIALAVLAGTGSLEGAGARLERCAALGELALDGQVKAVAGALPMAIGAREAGFETLLVPRENAAEASHVEGLDVLPIDRLADAVGWLRGSIDIAPARPREPGSELWDDEDGAALDFADVRGQEAAKRALEVAAAGSHNVIMVGPPGSGKTMLARRLSGILPDMSFEESIETTKIYSIAGMLSARNGLVRERPFRAPHHTASHVALVGGGIIPRPGECSLSHNGVLFLDELPEFSRNVLEVLRQPLEDRLVNIARAQISLSFPASFILCAAMNPCPCGYAGHPDKQCLCNPVQIARYTSRISGPLLDRIDLHVGVAAVRISDLSSRQPGERSAAIRERVLAARRVQAERFRGRNGIFANAQMTPRDMKEYCALDPAAQRLLENAMKALNLSARAYDRIRKVARTIADLAGSDAILPDHISEAVHYRTLDRMGGG